MTLSLAAQAGFSGGSGENPNYPPTALFIVVRVSDEQGKPILGLTKSNFKVWEVAPSFGDLPGPELFEDKLAPQLAGLYRLEFNQAYTYPGATVIAFYVTVHKEHDPPMVGVFDEGSAFCWLLVVNPFKS